ncbi:MAG: O-antigen ligase family protein [Magnetococcales bacterium]|nr:O-antigen ligase family protein [Magnetococcales bacterium]
MDNREPEAPVKVVASFPPDEDDSPSFRLLFGGFLLLMIWLPLPLGSNRHWAWGIMATWTFLLLAVWAISHLQRPMVANPLLRNHPFPFILFLGFSLIPLFQVIPLNIQFLRLLSPASLDMFLYAGQESRSLPISLDTQATMAMWLKTTAYLTGGWLVLVLARTRQRLTWLAWIMLLTGVAEAFYGLAMVLSGIEMIWWLPKWSSQGSAAGTFVNRNHFAGFLEMTIPLGFGLLIARLPSRSRESSWKEMIQYDLKFLFSQTGIVFILVVTMFIGLFLTNSRGGAAALLFSLFLISGLTFFRSYSSTREKRLMAPILAISILAGIWLGLGNLTGRLINTELEDKSRTAVFEATLGKIANYPMFGSGGGTFQYTFPLYRPEKIHRFYDHTHNDYLEMLADFGVVGFSLLALATGICWWIMLRSYLKRRDPLARGLLFASLSGTLSLALHGLYDFNLQIPSNAFYFVVLLAMGLQAGQLPHQSRRKGKPLV